MTTVSDNQKRNRVTLLHYTYYYISIIFVIQNLLSSSISCVILYNTKTSEGACRNAYKSHCSLYFWYKYFEVISIRFDEICNIARPSLTKSSNSTWTPCSISLFCIFEILIIKYYLVSSIILDCTAMLVFTICHSISKRDWEIFEFFSFHSEWKNYSFYLDDYTMNFILLK